MGHGRNGRRELNARISLQQEKLAKSLESLSDAVVFTDENWEILYVNQEAGSLIGNSNLAELIGCDVFDKFRVSGTGAPFDIPFCKEQILAGQTYVSDDHSFIRNDGTAIPVLLAINPDSKNGGPSGTIISFRNISEKKQSEAELQEARVEKEAAQRAHHTKSEFLANMSHEMRTPIHGMLGFVSVALNRIHTASPEKLAGYLRNIDESGQRLLALINDLLEGDAVVEFAHLARGDVQGAIIGVAVLVGRDVGRVDSEDELVEALQRGSCRQILEPPLLELPPQERMQVLHP